MTATRYAMKKLPAHIAMVAGGFLALFLPSLILSWIAIDHNPQNEFMTPDGSIEWAAFWPMFLSALPAGLFLLGFYAFVLFIFRKAILQKTVKPFTQADDSTNGASVREQL